MEEAKIREMVDRFLGWKLPDDFCPDAGISFEPEYNVEFMAAQGKPPCRHEPTGTNLLNADQAEQMIRHLLGDVNAMSDNVIDEVISERPPLVMGAVRVGRHTF